MTEQVSPMAAFTINPELEHELEPLEPIAFKMLERLIAADGRATDPLIVWQETGYLVDGHHRYKICTQHGLPFDVALMSFASMDEAKEYARSRQAARRNWNENALAYERGRLYREERQTVGGQIPGSRVDQESQKTEPPITTADLVAKQFNVSPATVKRDAKYAEAVETLLSDKAPKAPLIEASKSVAIKAAAHRHQTTIKKAA